MRGWLLRAPTSWSAHAQQLRTVASVRVTRAILRKMGSQSRSYDWWMSISPLTTRPAGGARIDALQTPLAKEEHIHRVASSVT